MPDRKQELEQVRALAERMGKVPKERRAALEGQLPFILSNFRIAQGFLDGLVCAHSVLLKEAGPEAAEVLRELVAVAARRVHWEQTEIDRIAEEENTPERLAAIEAEIEGMRSGQIPSIDADTFLREMSEYLDKLDAEKNGGDSASRKQPESEVA